MTIIPQSLERRADDSLVMTDQLLVLCLVGVYANLFILVGAAFFIYIYKVKMDNFLAKMNADLARYRAGLDDLMSKVETLNTIISATRGLFNKSSPSSLIADGLQLLPSLSALRERVSPSA